MVASRAFGRARRAYAATRSGGGDGRGGRRVRSVARSARRAASGAPVRCGAPLPRRARRLAVDARRANPQRMVASRALGRTRRAYAVTRGGAHGEGGGGQEQCGNVRASVAHLLFSVKDEQHG